MYRRCERPMMNARDAYCYRHHITDKPFRSSDFCF